MEKKKKIIMIAVAISTIIVCCAVTIKLHNRYSYKSTEIDYQKEKKSSYNTKSVTIGINYKISEAKKAAQKRKEEKLRIQEKEKIQEEKEKALRLKKEKQKLQQEEEKRIKQMSCILFIGDSRTEDLKNTLNSCDQYVCEVGKGYNWLVTDAEESIRNHFQTGSVVVISLGINDLGNIDNYISYFNSFQSTYGDCDLYINSIGPVDEETSANNGYTVTNSQIESFNDAVKKGLSSEIQYIDSYTYLRDNGFKATDGIHYTSDTTVNLYNYIKQCL